MDTELRPLFCQAKEWLEQQQQEIIQCVLAGFYQTEIDLYYGAFQVTGSLHVLAVEAVVMLWSIR